MSIRHIVVCIKPTASPAGLTYDPSNGAPVRPSRLVLSDVESAALQAALDLARVCGALVTALSVADESVHGLLEQALRTGANRAIRVWDANAAPLDAWVAAAAAAGAVGLLGADVVFCATRSADTGGESFAAALAYATGFELVTQTVALGASGAGLSAVMKLEKGWRLTRQVGTPVVVAVEDEIARPRHATRLGRVYRAGMARQVEVWIPEPARPGAHTRAVLMDFDLVLPRARTRAVMLDGPRLSAKDRLRAKKPAEADVAPRRLSGDVEAIARELVAQLRAWLP